MAKLVAGTIITVATIIVMGLFPPVAVAVTALGIVFLFLVFGD